MHTVPFWAVLGLLFVFPENRKLSAIMILSPLLIWEAVFYGLGKISMFASEPEILDVFYFAIIMGIAAKWLLAARIARRRWAFSFPILTGFVGLWAFSAMPLYIGTDIPTQAYLLLGILISIFALATFLTRWVCRNRFSRGKFIAFNGLAMFLSSFIIMGGWLGYSVIRYGLTAVEYIGQLLVMTLIIGALLYLVNLPFLIVAMWNKSYRSRFIRIFGFGVGEKGDSLNKEN